MEAVAAKENIEKAESMKGRVEVPAVRGRRGPIGIIREVRAMSYVVI